MSAADRHGDGLAVRTGQLAALASLDGLGPVGLGALLAAAEPVEVLDAIAATKRAHAVAVGRAPGAAHGSGATHGSGAHRGAGLPSAIGRALTGLATREHLARWRAQLERCPPSELARRCDELGVRAYTAGDDEFPEVLRFDPRPPAVLFVQGDLGALRARRAAVVGTRNATLRGRQFAQLLGGDLAAAGVVVVSGLARGVDAAAHRGALASGDGGVVAVVGNGHDAPYPRENSDLWRQVAARGAVIGEWPPGTQPDAFRFPLRNRLIAALSEVVVVVESRETGGSLITAVEAAERGVTVMAVPGDVRARASRGTNELIRDGAVPVTSSADVLTALSLDTTRASMPRYDPRPRPRDLEADVLARLRELPCTLDDVVTGIGVSITAAAMAVARLERSGWVRECGGWFEVVEVVDPRVVAT